MNDMKHIPDIAPRVRVLGMWLALIGVIVVWGALSLWSYPWNQVFAWLGFAVFSVGSWWTLTDTPAMVIWFPWGRPTVYYDPHQITYEDLGRHLSDPILDRACIRAWLWVELGWRRAIWSWTFAKPRWDVLVQIAAERVAQRSKVVPFDAALASEARWLRSTVTAFMLNHKKPACQAAIEAAVEAAEDLDSS